MNRRSLITGLASIIAAPAIVRASAQPAIQAAPEPIISGTFLRAGYRSADPVLLYHWETLSPAEVLKRFGKPKDMKTNSFSNRMN